MIYFLFLSCVIYIYSNLLPLFTKKISFCIHIAKLLFLMIKKKSLVKIKIMTLIQGSLFACNFHLQQFFLLILNLFNKRSLEGFLNCDARCLVSLAGLRLDYWGSIILDHIVQTVPTICTVLKK